MQSNDNENYTCNNSNIKGSDNQWITHWYLRIYPSPFFNLTSTYDIDIETEMETETETEIESESESEIQSESCQMILFSLFKKEEIV